MGPIKLTWQSNNTARRTLGKDAFNKNGNSGLSSCRVITQLVTAVKTENFVLHVVVGMPIIIQSQILILEYLIQRAA